MRGAMRCRRRKCCWAFVPPAGKPERLPCPGQRREGVTRVAVRSWSGVALRIRSLRFAGRSSLGNVCQARHEVVPPLGVARDSSLRQSTVDETKTSPGSHRLKVDLDRARSGWDHLVTLPAPGEHHAATGDDFDVLACGDVLRARELDAEPTARSRVELRELSLPANVLDRIG